MKRCTKCGQVKSLDAFPRKLSKADGRDGHCKACHAARKTRQSERGPRPEPTTASEAGWLESQQTAISVRLARAEFLSYSCELQEECRQYVRGLLAAEAKRGQVSHSYLWRYAYAIYGIE